MQKSKTTRREWLQLFASNPISDFKPSSVEKQLCFCIWMHSMLVLLAAHIFCSIWNLQYLTILWWSHTVNCKIWTLYLYRSYKVYFLLHTTQNHNLIGSNIVFWVSNASKRSTDILERTPISAITLIRKILSLEAWNNFPDDLMKSCWQGLW